MHVRNLLLAGVFGSIVIENFCIIPIPQDCASHTNKITSCYPPCLAACLRSKTDAHGIRHNVHRPNAVAFAMSFRWETRSGACTQLCSLGLDAPHGHIPWFISRARPRSADTVPSTAREVHSSLSATVYRRWDAPVCKTIETLMRG